MQKKTPLVVLAGPTASGKTGLSIALAKALGGAIVSADSMQVYRGMDIGSAKIRPEERDGIDHYLIDILEPEEEFHVALFQQLATRAIDEILAQGKLPILVGGTGFYIQALLRQVDFSGSSGKSARRKEMEEEAARCGTEGLVARLRALDPDAAEQIHPHNAKRLIRALEFIEETGEPISAHNLRERQRESAYRSVFFVLTDKRENLYRRIDARVDQMIADGLVEEVRALAERGLTEEHLSMKGLGYRQLLPYLRGEQSLEEAVARIKTETRHFCKRQLVWFRREPDAIWIDRSHYADEQEILQEMCRIVEEKGIGA